MNEVWHSNMFYDMRPNAYQYETNASRLLQAGIVEFCLHGGTDLHAVLRTSYTYDS